MSFPDPKTRKLAGSSKFSLDETHIEEGEKEDIFKTDIISLSHRRDTIIEDDDDDDDDDHDDDHDDDEEADDKFYELSVSGGSHWHIKIGNDVFIEFELFKQILLYIKFTFEIYNNINRVNQDFYDVALFWAGFTGKDKLGIKITSSKLSVKYKSSVGMYPKHLLRYASGIFLNFGRNADSNLKNLETSLMEQLFLSILSYCRTLTIKSNLFNETPKYKVPPSFIQNRFIPMCIKLGHKSIFKNCNILFLGRILPARKSLERPFPFFPPRDNFPNLRRLTILCDPKAFICGESCNEKSIFHPELLGFIKETRNRGLEIQVQRPFITKLIKYQPHRGSNLEETFLTHFTNLEDRSDWKLRNFKFEFSVVNYYKALTPINERDRNNLYRFIILQQIPKHLHMRKLDVFAENN